MALKFAVPYMDHASGQHMVVACLNNSQSSQVCSSRPYHQKLAGELQDERRQLAH